MRASLVLLLPLLLIGCSEGALFSASARKMAVLAQVRGGSQPLQPSPSTTPKKRVLVLDVDGTLYGPGHPLENQIAQRIKEYCHDLYGLTHQESDDLHHKYGSTINGLQVTRKLSEAQVHDFYSKVYEGLPVADLLGRAGSGSDLYGYQPQYRLSQALKDYMHAPGAVVVIASNSPRHHVTRVLAALGLAHLPFHSILTPESNPALHTKSHPDFWHTLLQAYPLEDHDLVLIEDSQHNLNMASPLGIKGIRVTPSFQVDRALAAFLGAIPDPSVWEFCGTRYLESKNVVDAQSFNPQVRARLVKELARLRRQAATDEGSSSSRALHVVDVGAGLLATRSLVLDMAQEAGWSRVEYVAYEMNREVVEAAVAGLVSKEGYTRTTTTTTTTTGGGHLEEGEVVLRRQSHGLEEAVTVRVADFSSPKAEEEEEEELRADLVVGCCLADLYQPHQLARMMMRRGIRGPPSGTLLYLPITFAGRTVLQPSLQEEEEQEGEGLTIPSDRHVMGLYHQSLTDHQGHNLDPDRLVATLTRNGATLLCQGPSHWHVSRINNPYLWDCLAYFFGLGVLTDLIKPGWDLKGWVRRLNTRHTDIHIANVDLLLRLPPNVPDTLEAYVSSSPSDAKAPPTTTSSTRTRTNRYVEFVGPRQVHVVEEEWGEDHALGPNQVEIQTVCSLISSGTELKVYRGDFDSDSAVDVTIKGMEDRMAYPLRYGYSLVGRVVRCGKRVSRPEQYQGRLVFCFSPHASRVVVEEEGLILVPPGIKAQDAVYFPSVETALSMVQDARPVLGERVLVVGAGLIGLLVVAIASQLPVDLTSLDLMPYRRALALHMGAQQACHPDSLSTTSEEFDTSIEISGHPKGLQAAIDHTGYGGKVVVGSWYGSQPTGLHLGLKFHRSHLRLVVSQVSRISTPLLGRWDKARRFAGTWDLLRRIRPSQFLTTRVVSTPQVAEAYHDLDSAAPHTVAIQIRYNDEDDNGDGDDQL